MVGGGWLLRRVRVFAAFDVERKHAPMAEGVVVGYAPSPTVLVRADDGSQSSWQVTLPIEVLAEDVPVPDRDWDVAEIRRRALVDVVAAARSLADSVDSEAMDTDHRGAVDRLVAELGVEGL